MGWSEKDFCIKCDKGGKVLACSDSSCPIAVHEKCLGFPAKFDEIGNFYCPYCSYRRAAEESRQAREKALLRKTALSSFIDMEMINGDKQMHEIGKSKWKESTVQKHPVQPEEKQEEDQFATESIRSISLHKENDIVLLDKKSKYGDNAGPSGCNDRLVVVGHKTPSGPIVACGHYDVSSEEEGTVQHFEMVDIGRRILLKHHKQLIDDQPAKTVENHIDFSDFSKGEKQGTENSKIVENDADPIEGNEGKVVREEEMEEQVQESNSSFAIDPAMPMDLEEKSGSESTDACGESNPTSAIEHVKQNVKRNGHPIDINCLRRSSRISCSALRANVQKIEELNALCVLKQVAVPSPEFARNLFPSVRRKKLPWKDDEEEMLREGVRKYSTRENKNIPWRKILEFGRHVFHGTRTPVDLKDKWRNILAKET